MLTVNGYPWFSQQDSHILRKNLHQLQCCKLSPNVTRTQEMGSLKSAFPKGHASGPPEQGWAPRAPLQCKCVYHKQKSCRCPSQGQVTAATGACVRLSFAVNTGKIWPKLQKLRLNAICHQVEVNALTTVRVCGLEIISDSD